MLENLHGFRPTPTKDPANSQKAESTAYAKIE